MMGRPKDDSISWTKWLADGPSVSQSVFEAAYTKLATRKPEVGKHKWSYKNLSGELIKWVIEQDELQLNADHYASLMYHHRFR